MTSQHTRSLIIQHADQLFYEQGFDHTSFAQIAKAVGISRGNFYYHFKTKDQILEEVIHHRLEKTKTMLQSWQEQSNEPADRIKCFIRILIQNGQAIMKFGCPVGTLTNELAKLNHPSRSQASSIFSLFRDWLAEQFSALRLDHSKTHAMTLLAKSQGIATLANAFKDKEFVQREVLELENWVDNLNPQGD